LVFCGPARLVDRSYFDRGGFAGCEPWDFALRLPSLAQVLFSYYDRNGVKLSEATVFSTPGGKTVELMADQRAGAHLGLAFAGPFVGYFGVPGYDISATGADGLVLGRTTVAASTNGNKTAFLDDLLPSTAGKVAVVSIKATQNTFNLPVYVIGLRFTGASFTTVPPAIITP